MMLAFTVIAIVAFALSRAGKLDSGAMSAVVSVVLVVAAGGVAYQTYRVGELGSKAVWNPTATSTTAASATLR